MEYRITSEIGGAAVVIVQDDTSHAEYILIGLHIRNARKAMGISQERLAELTDRSTSFVSHIERGTRKLSVETLIRIADVLDISTDRLLGRVCVNPDVQEAARELLETAIELSVQRKVE